jgi:arylformamidase
MTWKSSDYKPGSAERPIHKTLFKKAVILECLNLSEVPEGMYFLNAFPLRIEGASESPACPVLFTKNELAF